MKHGHVLGAIAAIVGTDGILKKIAEKKLAGKVQKRILGGRILLRLLHNDGAALGLLKKEKKLLLAFQSAALGAAVGRLFDAPKERHAERLGLILAIGGGCSNLIDRIRRGYVTDYFSIDLGERFHRLKRIVFNLSDLCIFSGGILWCIQRMSKSKS